MGGLLGGPKGMLARPFKLLWAGGCPSPPAPPPLFLRLCLSKDETKYRKKRLVLGDFDSTVTLKSYSQWTGYMHFTSKVILPANLR